MISSQEHEAKLARNRDDANQRARQIRVAAALEGELRAIHDEVQRQLESLSTLGENWIAMGEEHPKEKMPMPGLYPRLSVAVFEALRHSFDCLGADEVRAVALAYGSVADVNSRAAANELVYGAHFARAIDLARSRMQIVVGHVDSALASLRQWQEELSTRPTE